MVKYLKKFLLQFFGIFRFIEENSQLNIIKSIETGENGISLMGVAPTRCSKKAKKMTYLYFLNNKRSKKQCR